MSQVVTVSGATWRVSSRDGVWDRTELAHCSRAARGVTHRSRGAARASHSSWGLSVISLYANNNKNVSYYILYIYVYMYINYIHIATPAGDSVISVYTLITIIMCHIIYYIMYMYVYILYYIHIARDSVLSVYTLITIIMCHIIYYIYVFIYNHSSRGTKCYQGKR